MRITNLEVLTFTYRSKIVRDSEGHAHPGPEHEVLHSLTRVTTDEGAEGYCFGGNEALVHTARPMLIGQDPLDRERIWQTLRQKQRLERDILTDHGVAVIDMALWDLAGHVTGLPIYKLLGGYRDKVPAYVSTMCGDNIPGGLDSPQAYADFAETCLKQGYTAFKLHTWIAPLGPDPKRDVAACRAVRERVGPDVRLMLDCSHDYSREEALHIGRELERMGFYWFEEPMAEQLDIPIVGPETAEGKMYTRAEWIFRKASDISRYDVYHAGVTPMVKTVHLCESFGVRLEVHGGGAGNLQVLGAMGIPGEYYERGLLHPLLTYEEWTPWLKEIKEIIDPLDEEGYVRIPQKPGLGIEINWAFIERNKVHDWR